MQDIGQNAAAPRARLLFVDDEERILNSLKAVFRQQYDVVTTTDGREAIELLKRQPFQIIVSDQRMPEIAGIEVLRQAKLVSPRTIRMLLTGYSDMSAIMGSINDGEVFRFLQKPWRLKELEATMAEAAQIALEIGGAAVAAEAAAPATGEHVMVLDDDAEFAKTVDNALRGEHIAIRAASIDDALLGMQDREVAVIVADPQHASGNVGSFLKLLKRQHPHVMTIVATKAADGAHAIDMINQAKIFRITTKPVAPNLLRQFLLSAIRQYRTYRASPVLARQDNVQRPPQAEEAAIGQMILERIRGIRLFAR